MTISTTAASTILLGNGSTQTFNFGFIAGDETNIEVIFTDTDGTQTTLSSSQYTLVINPTATGQIWGIGGSVTYPIVGSPIASGTSLTISRVLPLTQVITITNQGDFAPVVIEEMGDTLEMQIQQLAGRSGQFRGTWITNTSYTFGDIVQDGANGLNSNNFYLCSISNISDTWEDDLAAGDWTLAISATLPVAPLPLSVTNGGTGAITSTGSGSVVLQTSPTLITPAIGVASATSINFGQGVLNYQATGTIASSSITLTFSTPGNVSFNYSTRDVTWERTGRTVALRGYIAATPSYSTSASAFIINGALPFTPLAANLNIGTALIDGFVGVVGSVVCVVNTSNQLQLYFNNTGNKTQITTSQCVSFTAKEIYFNVTYQV